jgi:hypothetical protein
MRTSLPAIILLVVSFVLGLQAMPAQAQLARTYVSAANGNDANDCNRSTPCRTFQVAHDNTLSAGEITVLDPGGYGAVTINRAISIINDGVGEAGVLVSGGVNGITISAGATDAVSLRGLTVKGIGFGGGNGIVFNSGATLTVENCAIRGLTGASPIGNGMRLTPSAASHLVVANTVVADNANMGIDVQPTGAGPVGAVFNRVETYHSGNSGIRIDGSSATGVIQATVTDSVTAGNANFGYLVFSNAGHAATRLMVARSTIVNNFTGLQSAQTAVATMRLRQSVITGNNNSWSVIGTGILNSYGDNSINGNGDGDPALPVIAMK